MHSLQVSAVVRLFLALWLAITPTFVWAGSMTLLGVGGPAAAGGGCSATFALDGTTSANVTAASNVISLTTANGCGLIVAAWIANASSSSVTAPGLTFTARSQISTGTGNFVEIWTAPYTTNFSGNVTVAFSASTFNTVSVFGVSGAKTSASFDSGGPQTNTTNPTVLPPITTTNANDFIFMLGVTGGTGFSTAGSGWTLINGANFQVVEYQIVAATQTALTPTLATGGSGNGGGITDAIKKGP